MSFFKAAEKKLEKGNGNLDVRKPTVLMKFLYNMCTSRYLLNFLFEIALILAEHSVDNNVLQIVM